MSYLIDTQIFIWAMINPEKLSEQTIEILQHNLIYVSQISLFEIAIKQKIGKLPHLTLPIKLLVEQAQKDNFNILNLKTNHLEKYNEIPLLEHHRDPFDRLLLATALSENMPIISADENFEYYHSYVQLIKN
jgi:PIN domain nuclease of toxin-antitoxin system